MNKRTIAKIRKWTLATLTDLFGPPWDESYAPVWIIPYGATGGTVQITFWDTWLACRLSNPIHLNPQGYTRPRAELDWPSWFTYPSGKFNLHSSPQGTFEVWERDFASHLFWITAPGSVERAKVEELTFVVS